MFDPFADIPQQGGSLRRLAALADGWSSSLFAAVAGMSSLGFSLAGLSPAAAELGLGALRQLSVFLAIIVILLFVAGPVIRFVDRAWLPRFFGSDGAGGAYGCIRDVPMSAVVRAFTLVHPDPYSVFRSSRGSSRADADGAHLLLAEHMVRALEAQQGGGRFLATMVALRNRVRVLSAPSVPVSVLLDAFDALSSDRSGLAPRLSQMLAAEVWVSDAAAEGRIMASDLSEALLSVSAMSDAQVATLQAFMQTSWLGSVKDLLRVVERVGG